MEFLRCFRCMEETHSYPCPCCGYAPGNDSSKEYALSPGTILNGRYVVGTTLGQGGFGITYVGWDLVLESKVAIKEYFPTGLVGRNSVSGKLHWYGTPQAENARDSGLEMSLKEARKMSRVRDIPQVVHVLDQFPENNTAYIVMDFVQGQTLKAYLDKKGPLTWEQTRTIFLPVIEAMEKAHDKGLIHRDLSPDNLMLLPDGSLKILDLGAAKDLNVNTGASSILVAKNGFSPLEQYGQRGSSGPWTDVYAMAATMYYALTCQKPPIATERLDNDLIRWDLPQLTDLPGHVLLALKNAMGLRHDQRTQTMGELARQLQGKALLIPDPPLPPQDDMTDVLREKHQTVVDDSLDETRLLGNPPYRRIIMALAGTLVLLLALILFLLVKPGRESQPSIPAEPTRITQETIPETVPLPTQAATEPPDPEPAPQTEPLVMETTPQVTTEPLTTEADSQLSLVPQSISGGRRHTVAIRQDGTVLSVGQRLDGQTYLDSWEDMVAVSANITHTVGLKANGTAVALGSNTYGQCNVEDWYDLVSISAGEYHTVGLKSDGTVVATGSNEYHQCDVEGWCDIIAVSAGLFHTVGLKADGTVVSTGWDIPTLHDVGDWTDIVAISAGHKHTVGLKANGTVVATGSNAEDQCDVSNWKNIVAIDTGYAFTMGLRADGSVVAVGSNGSGQCNLGNWKGIVAISAGWFHAIGLKADGTLVAAGSNEYHQCDVRSWSNILLPATVGYD